MSPRLALLACAFVWNGVPASGETLKPRPAPAFPEARAAWLGAPASWPALRGEVVLLNVWTFG
jgi:hypothetical protein